MAESPEEPRSADGADAAPEAASKPAPEEIEDLRRKAAERDEYLDLLKRVKADFANYQKRVAEDRKFWGEAAQRELIARLLNVADQCRLAAERSEGDDSADSLRSCIRLVWSELERFLDSSGLEAVPAQGERFDPEKHEAMIVQERDDVPDATILNELRPGYEFRGQVVRPAQVVVSRRQRPVPPETPVEGAAAEPEASGDGSDGGGPAEEPE